VSADRRYLLEIKMRLSAEQPYNAEMKIALAGGWRARFLNQKLVLVRNLIAKHTRPHETG